MTSKRPVERYPIESSPFYRMGRSADLARVLCVSQKKLTRLIVQRSALYRFDDREVEGKQRSLAVPTAGMRDLHERLKDLFSRIQLNEYLYSPRRGRSPVDNAEAHVGQKVIVKLDVRQFYPSTTDEHVFQFFRYRLRMVEDVAGRLTKLCTINGKVPFGSPLSPILCALVHDDVFGRAADMFRLDGCTMSLWVDDLTASGDVIRDAVVRDIKRLLRSKRLKTHKAVRTTGRRGLVVTGAFVGGHGVAPNNKAHKKMRDGLAQLSAASDRETQLKLSQSLIGQTNYFLQVYRQSAQMTPRLKGRLSWLHSVRRAAESSDQTTSLFTGTADRNEPPPW